MRRAGPGRGRPLAPLVQSGLATGDLGDGVADRPSGIEAFEGRAAPIPPPPAGVVVGIRQAREFGRDGLHLGGVVEGRVP